MFGLLAANVDAQTIHCENRVGMQSSRVAARAVNFDLLPSDSMHQPFGHLGTGAVMSANKQHPL